MILHFLTRISVIVRNWKRHENVNGVLKLKRSIFELRFISGSGKTQLNSEIKVPKQRKLKIHTGERLYPTYIQYFSKLDSQIDEKFTRKAGIICTIGPASRKIETLIELMDAGMDIARLNFSHGSQDYHMETMLNIRKAAEIRKEKKGYEIPIAIAIDTKGPEIRTGVISKGANSEEEIKRGSIVWLHTDHKYYDKGTASDIFIDYPQLPQILKNGSFVFIDDGLIFLKVQEIGEKSVKCITVNGGMLGSKKGVNLPGTKIDLPTISKKDKEDIEFGIDNNIDIIFASFTRNKEDIGKIKEIIVKKNASIEVIAKIENHQGLENLDEIIEASDGLMVARGDLGIEIEMERVFLAQKRMIAACNLVGKPVICATQMLESMTTKPRPTRAESSDVANAILDGADCVMLSGETAKGEYPVETVKVMADICRSAEAAVRHLSFFQDMSRIVPPPTDTTQSIAIAAVAAATKILATAILVITDSGYSAFVVSKFRPPCNVFAITDRPHIARKCYLYRGVIPVLQPKNNSDKNKMTETKINSGLKVALIRGHITVGDRVVAISGWRPGKGNTSTLSVIEITQEMVDKILKT